MDMFCAVGSQNTDRTAMTRAYAWRPLALLPILKDSAFTVTDPKLKALRRLEVYHRCMDHIVNEINALCKEVKYYQIGRAHV